MRTKNDETRKALRDTRYPSSESLTELMLRGVRPLIDWVADEGWNICPA